MSKNTVFLGIIAGATGLLNIFSIYLISTQSGVNVYGYYAMVLAVTVFVSGLFKLGLDTHVMKHCPALIGDYGACVALDYLRINKAVIVAACLAIFCVSQILTHIFITDALTGISFGVTFAALGLFLKVIISSLIRAMGGILVSQYFLRLGDILWFTTLCLIVKISDFVPITGGLLSLFWASAVGFNFSICLFVFYIFTLKDCAQSRQIRRPEYLDIIKAPVGELFYFSSTNVISTAVQNLDVLLIGYLNGQSATGVFSILKRSANQIYVLVGIFQIQFWPQLSKASAKSDTISMHRLLYKTRRAVSYSLPALCVMAIGLAFFLLTQAETEINFDLILAFGFLMLGMIANALFLFAVTLANLNGLERVVFWTFFVSGVVYFSLILLGGGELLIASMGYFFYQIVNNAALAIHLYRYKEINLFSVAVSK